MKVFQDIVRAIKVQGGPWKTIFEDSSGRVFVEDFTLEIDNAKTKVRILLYNRRTPIAAIIPPASHLVIE